MPALASYPFTFYATFPLGTITDKSHVKLRKNQADPPVYRFIRMADNGTPSEAPAPVEHLNIKVTDNNNEVFFKIKRTTQLKKLMDAFCERQGKQLSTVRFLFDGTRVRPEDTPDTVRAAFLPVLSSSNLRLMTGSIQLEMADGDTLEVHQEQIGG